jgi:GTP-binding protein
MGNIVAIVGRPNVGKSTLFNRLTESKSAIVDETSGVTRDRHYGKVIWNGKEFSIIDTGGLNVNSGDVFEEEIKKHVLIAINESDVILFLVDAKNGITDLDQAIANLLYKVDKPVFLVVNKVDNNQDAFNASEFYGLGLGDYYNISAMSGSGSGDLLDDIVNTLPHKTGEEELDLPKYAIVGRPNVGKSSLLNVLVSKERNIVTDIPGTTRDSIYTRYSKYNHDFYLIDTAGLRKKGKVHENLEFYSVMRSIRAIEHSDVCLLLIDATRGMESQDVNIFNLIQRNRKGVVILVNKWDLIEKETNTSKFFTEAIAQKIAPFTDVPIVFISTLTKQRIHKVLETAIEVYNNRRKRIPTHQLNEVLSEAIENYPPPSVKGKYIKIKYVTQLPTHAPSFALFCNLPQYVREPYKRYIENKIRENFDFKGIPIQVFFRKK